MKSLQIPENQIYNAYLLLGTDRKELEDAALGFAGKLLSGGRDQARADKRVRENVHPDFSVIRPDKPLENPRIISVDNIRDNITDTVNVRPYEAEYKVYVILQAEKMNPQAQNALLKTLEEPPGYVVIMLLAEREDVFLPTILSRVIEIRAGERDVSETLREMLREEWAQETTAFLSGIRHRSVREILDYTKQLDTLKADTEQLFSFIGIVFRDVLCYKSTRRAGLLFSVKAEEAGAAGTVQGQAGPPLSETVIGLASELSYEKLGELTEKLQAAVRGQRVNVGRALQLEELLLCMREQGDHPAFREGVL